MTILSDLFGLMATSKNFLRIGAWIVIGIIIGYLTSTRIQAIAANDNSHLPLAKIQQMAAVYGLVKRDYVEVVSDDKLIKEAIKGMVAGLDPHSQYFDEDEYEEFREGTTGKFAGIGIEITAEDGFLKVVSPIEDSPAQKAGLLTNDIITRVDTTPVKGLGLQESVKRIRGEIGTSVQLTIFRRSESRTFNVTIVRDEIHSNSVKGKLIEPGFAWIRISQFQNDTTDEFVKKFNELATGDVPLKGLVLDLRNDPGGLLDSAIGISAAFLPRDAVVVSTKGQIKEANQTFRANPKDYLRSRFATDPLAGLPPTIKTIPLVVLVNEGSASASEIVAGAIKDHQRGTILGHRSFGKGTVQTVRNLSENTALKLTTARYYTPSGGVIQAKGVTPDFYVDEVEGGDPLSLLRVREADLIGQIGSGNQPAASQQESDVRRKKLEEVRTLIEEERSKIINARKPVIYGDPTDYQLQQALNHLKGKEVKVTQLDLDDPSKSVLEVTQPKDSE